MSLKKGEARKLSLARCEDYLFLIEMGETRENACERLGVRWDSMLASAKRHGIDHMIRHVREKESA